APWELNRQGREGKLRTVLYNAAEAIRLCGMLISPFLVQTPARLWRQLGWDAAAKLAWDEAKAWGQLPAGLAVQKGEPLFPRLDIDEVLGAGAQADPAGAPGGGGEAAAQGAAPGGAAATRETQATTVSAKD